ncbi:MAG TPA: N-acetylmuramoyl-L-alanine amidase [Gemmatimonadaceae bacterium]|nr:N-acetylmuramoyl-L-alanine amidase [Gemmatimonadaceae bacterium]
MRIARLAPLALVALACRPTPAPTSNPGPRPPVSPPTVPTFERGITPRKAPPLPAIPLVEGPLEPKVVYPPANERISVDSNFIFGSVGNGHATLTINGANVPVAPNGTFLAFLPVPPPTAPRYELVARTATDSAHLEVPVRVPPPRVEFSATGPLIVDSGTVSPRGVSLALRDDEPVRVSVRAAPGATGWVLTSAKRRLPLVNTDAQHLATDVLARDLRSTATLYVARDRDTVHFALSRVDSVGTEPRYATLVPTGGGPDTDATIIGRSTPHGTYKWMLLPGTIVQVTGRNGDNARVRLDSQLETWVDAPNVRELPAGEPGPRRVIGAMALVPSPDWVDIVMPVSSPPPFLLEQDMTHLTLTMYGTEATPDIIKYLQNDSLVRVINWVPVATDRVRFDIELTEQPYGYLAMYDSARSAFVLRLRRAPVVSLAHPLQGLTITVDPGHPPGGAIGPTALTEAQGVLWVAEKLKTILEQRGAHVVMTRTTMDAVDLHERSVIARQTNSYALISVHLNAFGEGVDPFPNVGTSTLFFHPQTEPLARLVQAGMMREMGLRDLGIHYQNIAIGRTTWMPSLICEGAFLMVPEQENAIKTPAFQERYATGIADGLEAYFRTFAKR